MDENIRWNSSRKVYWCCTKIQEENVKIHLKINNLMDFCNPRRKYTSLNGHLDTINYVPSSTFMKMYKKEQDGRKGKDNFLLRKSQSLSCKSSAVSKDKQELWVQKYRPTRFTDLLSLDVPQCNILRFLTEWKDCISGNNGGDSNNENKNYTDLPKILLISGSSGVGKTCIAHCATHAAGFHPVEINAGEGRTLESLKDVITSSLSNNHVIDKCPSLLIVDEIDSSADNASLISFIIKLVQRTKKATLIRPIIMICSDPYSPILKGIRKLCHLHQPLYPPTPSQISKYLNGIIQKEGHSKMLDQRHLLSLILSMDCDLRAILNAVQFHLLFSTRTTSSSASTTFFSLVKDDLKHNALHISRDIFKGSTKVCVKNLDSTLSDRVFSNSLDLLPEYWGLMDGSRDCMSVGSGGLSGTKVNSSSSSSLSSLQRMSSLYYLLSTATSTKSSILLIKKAFSTNAKSPKEFRIPNRDFILTKETERISSECSLSSTSASASSASCKNDAFLERNSFLCRIVDHGIREMKVSNVQLLKEGSLEILKLKRIIELMLSERLSFILDPSSKSFKLSPFIEWTEFKFDNGFNEGLNDGDGDGAERISSNHINSVKQMVSSLLEKSRIDVSRSGELKKTYSGLTMRGGHQEIGSGAGGVDDDITTDKRRSYFFTDRSVKRARKDDGGFIGGSLKEKGMEKENISFWFKYNEGFSNAVRRTIRMDDLFPKPQINK